jgi:hydroxyethylthiazole kinase
LQQINDIRSALKQNTPLIHCITNPISINQCANVILSAGARPMMAEHPEEAAEITKTAGAVMLNLGNLTDVRKQSMLISAAQAKQSGTAFILDICGAACLPTRREYALRLINTSLPTVIKGNYSEIMALADDSYSSTGVDADKKLTLQAVSQSAGELAKKLAAVILASGETDIITDGTSTAYVHNGCAQLGSVTGTGCMQGALCAAYLSAANGFDAAAAASVVFGICGQLAQTQKGSGSFMVNLLDALSTVDGGTIDRLTDITFDKQN